MAFTQDLGLDDARNRREITVRNIRAERYLPLRSVRRAHARIAAKVGDGLSRRNHNFEYFGIDCLIENRHDQVEIRLIVACGEAHLKRRFLKQEF